MIVQPDQELQFGAETDPPLSALAHEGIPTRNCRQTLKAFSPLEALKKPQT
jgi:hypothetical protein